ncbi:MAG: sugar ABC transporter permease [Anaerolineales bacterium]|nr:sugar ABC transporter permease [Anaerolineales bacterium]
MKVFQDIKRHWFIYLSGVIIPLAAYAVFIGYPLFRSIYLSFFKWDGLGEKTFVGFDQYQKMFSDPSFITSLHNNIIWALGTLLFPVVGGLILAILFNSKRVYFGSFYRILFFLPSTTSLAATGIVFSVILNPVFGGVNEGLRAIGLESLILGWLDDPKVALYTLLFVFSWNYMGMPMIMFHAGLGQIEPELFEMAQIEGANPLQTVWYVTLPMLKPVITVVALLVVIISFRAFDLVTIMTKGGPAKQTNVLAYLMYNEAFHKYNFGYGATISVAILALSIFFAIMYLKNVTGDSVDAK